MTTEAAIGHGTRLEIANMPAADPIVYTFLAEITNIQPPGVQRELHDVTHMDSPDRWREFITGLKEGSEMSVTMNFVPGGASDERLREMYDEADPAPMRITFPNGSQMGFSAFIQDYQPDVEVGAPMTAEATFKMTGPPDYTDPS